MTDDGDLIERLIQTATARTIPVRVCARGDLVEQYAELSARAQAELPDDGTLADASPEAELAHRILEVEAEIEASHIEILVTSIPALDWTNLQVQHSPTKDQVAKGYDHNPLTFPAAVVAACAVKPTMTLDQAKRLQATLHTGEWNKLYLAVHALNNTQTPLPKLQGASERLRQNERSATPSDHGSLAAGSSGSAPEQ